MLSVRVPSPVSKLFSVKIRLNFTNCLNPSVPLGQAKSLIWIPSRIWYCFTFQFQWSNSTADCFLFYVQLAWQSICGCGCASSNGWRRCLRISAQESQEHSQQKQQQQFVVIDFIRWEWGQSHHVFSGTLPGWVCIQDCWTWWRWYLFAFCLWDRRGQRQDRTTTSADSSRIWTVLLLATYHFATCSSQVQTSNFPLPTNRNQCNRNQAEP